MPTLVASTTSKPALNLSPRFSAHQRGPQQMKRSLHCLLERNIHPLVYTLSCLRLEPESSPIAGFAAVQFGRVHFSIFVRLHFNPNSTRQRERRRACRFVGRIFSGKDVSQKRGCLQGQRCQLGGGSVGFRIQGSGFGMGWDAAPAVRKVSAPLFLPAPRFCQPPAPWL